LRLLLRLPVLADQARGQTVARLAAIARIAELEGVVLGEARRQLGQPGFRLKLGVQHLLAGAIVHDAFVFIVIFPVGRAVGIADAVGTPLLPALVDRIGGRPVLACVIVALLAARIAGKEIEILALVGADNAAGAACRRKQG